jgi:UV DNA damage repair endonuclease
VSEWDALVQFIVKCWDRSVIESVMEISEQNQGQNANTHNTQSNNKSFVCLKF